MRSKVLQDFYKKLAGYNYIPPDLENTSDFTLIYDFYFLESLRGIDLSPKREDINLQTFYEECIDKVVTKLKNTLINDLLPYAFDRAADYSFYQSTGRGDRNWEEQNANFSSWLMQTHPESLEYYNISDTEEVEELAERVLMDLHPMSYGYKSVQNYPLYPEIMEYIEILKESSGKKDIWYDIYNTLQDLKNTSDPNSIIILIDHILDMQHHSGNILERVLSEEKLDVEEEDTNNINTMLNIKSNIMSIEEFLPLISFSLVPFAQKVIYNLTGRTEEMRNEE